MCSQVGNGKMSNTRRFFQGLNFAIFILCYSMATYGKPVDDISNIKKRSVSEHQFMHDKSRSIQELQRRIWLNNVMGELHTAEGRGLTQPQPPSSPKHPATWPDSPDLAALLIKLASNNEGTKTPAEQLQETKPGALKYQNAKKTGKKKKQGKNNRRKAQKGRQEKSRRHARSAGSEVRDPGIGLGSNPLLNAVYGRLWH
ncbi:parathyroid hormone-related protein-like isoform X1 [Hypanus sabinus]|uniref:parathyroid hormone-related protein-like isoform X1 n=2 Tax=Hypanus sabinus TaxID=79690 RepID=UPI0028C44CD7|nr:parathyroid hormone-related protein-like isoform X1 [Hypanus sabinus]